MRVELPDDTDLNHYFEIMNSRGEQLEKHEILKSYLMNVFNDDRLADTTEQEENKNCLHLVWEACANMEKYVQMGFTADQRAEIFGKDWSEFEVRNFDELREKLKKDKNASSDRGDALSLSDIIDQPESGTKAITPKEDEAPERFKTVINFPISCSMSCASNASPRTFVSMTSSSSRCLKIAFANVVRLSS